MARTNERFREAFNALLENCMSLAPGDELPSELALAERLGVSRTIVRAVLERMQADGLLRWDGRIKELVRLPLPSDHLATSGNGVTPDELERKFLDWVLRCDVLPGTSLNVTDLARRFHVPAHALQEFLASLSRFGLVKRRVRGGWELLGFTRDYASELSDFRMILELNAVSALIVLPREHPVWDSLTGLEAEHHRLAEEIDNRFNDFSALDERFHATIAGAVRNRFAEEFQHLIAMIFHYHYQWDKTDERERNKVGIFEHLRLIDALKAGDEAAALSAARSHLLTAGQTLLSAMR